MAKKTTCTPWQRVSKRSGSNPYERTCGNMSASIIKWKPNEWSAVVERNGEYLGHVYGKTLKAAKAAATRKMKRGR